jgi:hypothetical protein
MGGQYGGIQASGFRLQAQLSVAALCAAPTNWFGADSPDLGEPKAKNDAATGRTRDLSLKPEA